MPTLTEQLFEAKSIQPIGSEDGRWVKICFEGPDHRHAYAMPMAVLGSFIESLLKFLASSAATGTLDSSATATGSPKEEAPAETFLVETVDVVTTDMGGATLRIHPLNGAPRDLVLRRDQLKFLL